MGISVGAYLESILLSTHGLDIHLAQNIAVLCVHNPRQDLTMPRQKIRARLPIHA